MSDRPPRARRLALAVMTALVLAALLIAEDARRPAAAQANTGPIGSVARVEPNGIVTGWACDRDRPDYWLGVTAFVDGVRTDADGIASEVRGADDEVIRTICGGTYAVHGFRIDLPARFLDGTRHTVTVRAADAQTLAEFQVGGPKSFATVNRAPVGALDPGGRGWARDPDTPTAAVEVHWAIHLVGDEDAVDEDDASGTVRANLLRRDVGPHGFSIPVPARFRTGEYELRAVAVDTAGNGELDVALPGGPRRIPAG